MKKDDASSLERNDDSTQIFRRLALPTRYGGATSPTQCNICARDTVLAQLTEGRPVDIGLLVALARPPPLAGLSATPERARLWSILPVSQREHYLQATATGRLDVAAKGTAVTPLKPRLSVQSWRV